MTHTVFLAICPCVRRLLLVLLWRLSSISLHGTFVSRYLITFLLYFFSYFLTTHVTVPKLQKLPDSDSMGYNPIITDNQKTNSVNHSSSVTQPDDLHRKVSICTNPALCPVSTSCYRILSSHAFLRLSPYFRSTHDTLRQPDRRVVSAGTPGVSFPPSAVPQFPLSTPPRDHPTSVYNPPWPTPAQFRCMYA